MIPVLPPGRYYGNRQRSRIIPRVALIENAYAPAFVIPRHAHATPFFGLVLEGGYRETFDGRCRECTPSSLLFHPKGEIHSEAHHDVVVRIFTIEPNEQLLEHVNEYARMLEGPHEFHAGPLLQLGARLYREFRRDDPVSALAMEGIVLELLADACRNAERHNTTVPPRWLRRAGCFARPIPRNRATGRNCPSCRRPSGTSCAHFPPLLPVHHRGLCA